MWRRWIVGLTLVVPACFGGGGDVTESGLGKPQITVDIPQEVEAGSIQDVTIAVHNPGPGEIDSLAVAFALVGPVQDDGGLPTSVVAMSGDSSVVAVKPEPTGISSNGTVYVFGGGPGTILPEGEEVELVFTLKMPTEPGVAANSVQVYDGGQVDRATGARLETRVVD